MTKDKSKKKATRKKRTTPKKISYNPGDKTSRKNLVLIGGAALAVIAISAVIFMTLTSLFSTESYYVLNTNVKAKQQITPEMVEARETAEGTGPIHALSMEEIQRGGVYSKYPLFAGDVIARSNAGPLSGTPLGIPDDWLVTSFTINSTDAVGGILGKGDYVDLIGVKDEGVEESDRYQAQYIFNNLLILEIKFLNDEYDGDLDGQTILGETMHYTVGLPAEHVAHLHSALAQYSTIKMVKAPTEINYADRNVANLDKPFKYGSEIGNIDVIVGSDPTFTEIERDEDGRPIAKETDDAETDKDGSADEEELDEGNDDEDNEDAENDDGVVEFDDMFDDNESDEQGEDSEDI